MYYIFNITKIDHISYVFYVNYVVNTKIPTRFQAGISILYQDSSDLLLRLQLKEQPEE